MNGTNSRSPTPIIKLLLMRGSLTDLNELGNHTWHLTNQSEWWIIRLGVQDVGRRRKYRVIRLVKNK